MPTDDQSLANYNGHWLETGTKPSPTNLKYDGGKPKPSLVPVEFRSGLRFADKMMAVPDHLGIEDVYTVIENYEEGDSLVVGLHTLIQAGQYLQALCGNNLGCSFLMGVAKVMTMGAVKYSVGDWKRCPYDGRFQYVDAFYRHCYAWEGGEELDTESGLHHLYHAGACLAILHWVDVHGRIASPAPVEKENITRAMDAFAAQAAVECASILSSCKPINFSGANATTSEDKSSENFAEQDAERAFRKGLMTR